MRRESFTQQKGHAAEGERGERIAEAALRYKGEIFTGATHLLALQKLQEKYPHFDDEDVDAMPLEDREGFVTDAGRWVNRREAFSIAKKAGQIDAQNLSPADLLRSEYLK